MLPYSNALFWSSTNPQDNLPHGKKLHSLGAPLIAFCLGTVVISGCSTVATETAPTSKASQAAIVALEKKYDAAIGVSLRDAKGKVLLEWRSRERFPLTSTVKALECARVYELGLENHYAPIKTTPIVPHSPVYGKVDPDTQVTLKEACRAALSQSDNRAANFIFVHTGGPKALTEWLRQKGDNTTRSDRLEPDLNLSGKNDTATQRHRAMHRSIGSGSTQHCLRRLVSNGCLTLHPIRWPAICSVRASPKTGRFTTVPEQGPMNTARPAPIMRFWSRTKVFATMPPCI